MPPPLHAAVGAYETGDSVSQGHRDPVASPPSFPNSQEWRQTTARQIPQPAQARQDQSTTAWMPYIPEPDYNAPTTSAVTSINSLHAAVIKNLETIRSDWQAIQSVIALDQVCKTLSDDYSEIIRFAETVESHGDEDFLGVEKTIKLLDDAMEKLRSGGCKPWQPRRRSIGAQLSRTNTHHLTPKAKAAFDTLDHLNRALELMAHSLSARRTVETQRRALQNASLPPKALETAQAELRVAMTTTSELLYAVEPLINRHLTEADTAIPKERQRTKKKLWIALTVAFIAVALLAAAALAPYLGLAVGTIATVIGVLKFCSLLMGVVSIPVTTYAVIGYKRNRGWDRLAKEVTSLRNLNSAINAGFQAKNVMLHSDEIGEIQEHHHVAHHDVRDAQHAQIAICKALGMISSRLPTRIEPGEGR